MLQRAAIITETFSTNRVSLGLRTILWESLNILIQRTFSTISLLSHYLAILPIVITAVPVLSVILVLPHGALLPILVLLHQLVLLGVILGVWVVDLNGRGWVHWSITWLCFHRR